MSPGDALSEHVRDNRRGMVADLAFAVAWVTAVSLLFDVVDGPRWAYYLLMAAGVVAYVVFFASLAVARAHRRQGK